MKSCPTCGRNFTDPNLSFCIEDGTPLVKAEVPDDAEATVVSSSSRTGSDNWGQPAYQPPPIFPPPPAAPKKKLWPWVVGSLAVLLLVFTGLGIAAAILVPKMMREAEDRNANRSGTGTNTNSGNEGNANSNTNANANGNENSNSSDDEANADDEKDKDSAPPTNQEVVLSDLKNIEDEWTAANLNADKKKLEKILADDYVGTDASGSMQGKADYLRDIKPDPSVQHWEFQNLKLALNGRRATLTGVVNLESSQQSEPLVLRFTDKFVWRDNRWQAVSSEVASLNESKN
jgi:Domain of unknown function (DUF4440)